MAETAGDLPEFLAAYVSVRRSAVDGESDLARTLRSVERRGGGFGDRRGGLTGGLPRGREHGRHVAQPHAAREARQDVGQVLDWVHADEPAAAEDRIGDRGALAARV